MSREQGASTLELALITPFLFLLALGVVDFGQVLAVNIAITEAAQEGVAFGIHEPADPVPISQRVLFAVDEPNLVAEEVAITCPSNPSDHIAVTVTHDIDLMTPLIANLFGGTVTVSTTAVGEIISEDSCVAS